MKPMESFKEDLLAAAAKELQRKLDRLERRRFAPFRNLRHRILARKYAVIMRRMKT